MQKIYTKHTINRQVWEYNIMLLTNENQEFIFHFALNDVSNNTYNSSLAKLEDMAHSATANNTHWQTKGVELIVACTTKRYFNNHKC